MGLLSLMIELNYPNLTNNSPNFVPLLTKEQKEKTRLKPININIVIQLGPLPAAF